MIADLLDRLFAPKPSQMSPLDSQHALAALLVRIAKADGNYSLAEIKRIDRLLAQRYQLNSVDAAKLRAQAETIEHAAPDTVRFTRAIKEAVPYEDRLAVIETMWAVVLADGTRDAEEDALLRMIAPLLGVEDQDSALARQRVEAKQAQAT